jgi:hypothetical protein
MAAVFLTVVFRRILLLVANGLTTFSDIFFTASHLRWRVCHAKFTVLLVLVACSTPTHEFTYYSDAPLERIPTSVESNACRGTSRATTSAHHHRCGPTPHPPMLQLNSTATETRPVDDRIGHISRDLVFRSESPLGGAVFVYRPSVCLPSLGSRPCLLATSPLESPLRVWPWDWWWELGGPQCGQGSRVASAAEGDPNETAAYSQRLDVESDVYLELARAHVEISQCGHGCVRCDTGEPTSAPAHPAVGVYWPSAATGYGVIDTPRCFTCTLCDFPCSPGSSAPDGVIHGCVRCAATDPTGAPLPLPEGPYWPSAAPGRDLVDAPRFITCALCDFPCSPESSLFGSAMHSCVHCGAAEPTGAPLLLPECPYWPPAVSGRGLIDAPRLITCALCDFSCSPEPSVFGSVMQGRVRCDAAVPTGSPLPLSECPSWPSAAPARGLIDALGFITFTLCDFSCAPKSSVFDSVMRCGAAEPTGAPLPLPECPRWPPAAPERGLFDAPRVIACALSDFPRSPESSVFDSVIHEGVRYGAAEPTGAPPPLPECSYCPPQLPFVV